jgi:hypothetical protein
MKAIIENTASRSVLAACRAIAEGKWISYLRVSIGRQGKSGLGIEAQRNADL